jgi:hypothetical protein
MNLEQEITNLNLKVDRLLFVIIGDEDMGQTGLAKKVQTIDKWMQEKKAHDAKVIAISSGVSGLVIYFLNIWLSFKG